MNKWTLMILLVLGAAHNVHGQNDSMLDYSKYALQFYEEFDYLDPIGQYPSAAFRDSSLRIISTSANPKVTTNGLNFRQSWDISRSDEWGAGNEFYAESQVTMPQAGVIRLQEAQTLRFKNKYGRRIDYLTGTLMSKGYFSYGIFEARIKLSEDDDAKCGNSGAGFWTTPTYYDVTEIDIMDCSHNNWLVQRVGDWEAYNYRSLPTNTVTRETQGHPLSDSFHIISCEWRPDLVKFYLDGKYIADINYQLVRTYGKAYQFILATGACATESLNPDSSTNSGHYIDIDWVKCWQPARTDSVLDLYNVSVMGFPGAELMPGLYNYRQVQLKGWALETVANTYVPTIIKANVTTIYPGFQADQSVLHTVEYSDQNKRVRNGFFEIVPDK